MKKKWILLILCVFLFPWGVKAYGMDQFYSKMTVETNGDIEIEEYFAMNGDYNGFERIINYRNGSAPRFDGSVSSFGGSSIYNGSGISIEEVRGIPKKASTSDLNAFFTSLKGKGDTFVSSGSASKGDYGKYTLARTTNGVKVKIFNPKSSVGFYIRYKVKNVAVLHNDVAEIGWNIFSDEMKESIGTFRMVVNIPMNQSELRAFAHGPLTGDISLQGKNQFTLSIDGLPAYTAMDTRFVFDRSVIAGSNKKTDVEALPLILEYEGKMADEANAYRDKVRGELAAEEKRRAFISSITIPGFILWLLGLGGLTFFIYRKYDKEYAASFKGKYYRDFPSDAPPEVVGYLMNRKVGTNDLSASILNLIYKKAIRFEPIPNDKKDYTLYLEATKNNIKLSLIEEKVVYLLFGNNEKTTLKEFKKKAKNSYTSFLNDYTDWHTMATTTAEAENFYEKAGSMRIIPFFYALLGLVLSIYTMNYVSFIWINVCVIITSVIFMIYLFSFTRRTVRGNEEYAKWKGLKNFINDFGSFKERELPQITLWEKYLVYAVTFGTAEKLVKQMEIKIQSGMVDTMGMDTTFYTHDYFTTMFVLNHVINTSVVSAHSSAISAQNIANSSNSSSGGFGGGFSSGGGSFGGGGGGGRF